jgi:regulator of RNase E activity RraB
MKSITLVTLLFFALTLVSAQESPKAKITKAQATKIALQHVKGGKITDAELEKEEGKLVWSFDIKVGKVIKEVWVDAQTGLVIKTEVESASKEKAESKADKAEKKEVTPEKK